MGEIITISNSGKSLPAYIAKPDGAAKGGLLVIHEVWGLTDHIKDVAERFAREGYLVLAPDLLSETAISQQMTTGLQEALFDPQRRSQVQPQLRALMTPLQAPNFGQKTIDKLKRCFNYLCDQPEAKHSVAVAGFCFGGTYSFSLAIYEPRLKIAIPFYGHCEFAVDELKSIECPIRAFYGQQDERLIASLPELKDKMQAASVDFTEIVYPDCGHAFFNDTNKFAYNQAAAEAAWKQTLEYLASS